MARQESYRARYRRLRPGWNDSQRVLQQIVRELVSAESRVLDVGCGHGDFLSSAYSGAGEVWGVDPDPAALGRNRAIANLRQGSVESLPFAAAEFDLVIMTWVAEHLERPQRALGEITRVLRPGGRLLILTPNAWNYNTWLIRAVPNRLHHSFTKRLYGRQDRDTYPVRYRMNTPARLRALAAQAGLTEERLLLNGDPTYVAFNPVLFWLAVAAERVLDQAPLRRGRVHLIGQYRRTV